MIDWNGNKCVIIIDESLPIGLIANTAAVLAANVGRDHPEIFGPDVLDASGIVHPGMTAMPFPVLRSTPEGVRKVYDRARQMDGLEICAFSNVAQTSRADDEYTGRLAATQADDLAYLGVMLFGTKKHVNKISSSLGLLR